MAGIKEGDFIVEIAGIDVKWYTHQEIVNLIQTTGSSCLEMKIITPMDRNYLKVNMKKLKRKRFCPRGHYTFLERSEMIFKLDFNLSSPFLDQELRDR